MDKTILASKGFTLVEIVVSLMVISVGLLGLAGLQVNSMKQNMDAYLKSTAAILANDMADRMRANLNAVQSGQYGSKNKLSAYTLNNQCAGGGLSSQSNSTVIVSSAICDDEAVAENDLFEWRQSLQTLLPDAIGQVCRTSYPGSDKQNLNCDNIGNVMVISVSWIDRKNNRQVYRMALMP